MVSSGEVGDVGAHVVVVMVVVVMVVMVVVLVVSAGQTEDWAPHGPECGRLRPRQPEPFGLSPSYSSAILMSPPHILLPQERSKVNLGWPHHGR